MGSIMIINLQYPFLGKEFDRRGIHGRLVCVVCVTILHWKNGSRNVGWKLGDEMSPDQCRKVVAIPKHEMILHDPVKLLKQICQGHRITIPRSDVCMQELQKQVLAPVDLILNDRKVARSDNFQAVLAKVQSEEA